jgi:hypothetical protein
MDDKDDKDDNKDEALQGRRQFLKGAVKAVATTAAFEAVAVFMHGCGFSVHRVKGGGSGEWISHVTSTSSSGCEGCTGCTQDTKCGLCTAPNACTSGCTSGCVAATDYCTSGCTRGCTSGCVAATTR